MSRQAAEQESVIGYCTNVHAGSDFATTCHQLTSLASEVRRQASPLHPLPLGLWFSARTAEELIDSAERRRSFARLLAEHGLAAGSINGFPYGDFHRHRVKHAVYQPPWWDPARERFTRMLIELLAELVPEESVCSISTLPIGWGTPPPSPEQRRLAAESLLRCAEQLAEIEERLGTRILLCLEPEPGCCLQRVADIVQFFDDHLASGRESMRTRRYLGVCHDICHAAVMHESQADVIRRLAEAEIPIGKIQVSSALEAVFPSADPAASERVRAELARFVEPRYLHQTVWRDERDLRFYEDLEQALGDNRQSSGSCRVHFHVPIFLTALGDLGTTQGEIIECLHACRQLLPTAQSEIGIPFLEIETYAWGVMPAAHKPKDLAEGIHRELTWLRAEWRRLTS